MLNFQLTILFIAAGLVVGAFALLLFIDSTQKKTIHKVLLFTAFLMAFVAIFPLFNWRYLQGCSFEDINTIMADITFENLGTYGDYLGGVLGGLSIFLVLYQINEQKKQFSRQNFETIFHNMIAEQNELRNRISYRDIYNPTKEYTSDHAIQRIRHYITERCYTENYSDSLLDDAYSDIYIYSNGLSQYFRHLYHILRITKESNSFTFEEKKEYTKLLASTLSLDELALCFYNGRLKSKEKKIGEKSKELMKEFDFLENLRTLNDYQKGKLENMGTNNSIREIEFIDKNLYL